MGITADLKIQYDWTFLSEIQEIDFYEKFFKWLAVCKQETPKFLCSKSSEFRVTNNALWDVETVIYYGVKKNNFLNAAALDFAASELFKAANFWNQISPIKFEFTDDESKMIFCLDYRQENHNRYAQSFFPHQHKDQLSHLYLYAEAFKPEIVEIVFKILLHELGHILGLCHTILEQNSKPSIFKFNNIVLDTIMNSNKFFQFNDGMCTEENLASARSALVDMYKTSPFC